MRVSRRIRGEAKDTLRQTPKLAVRALRMFLREDLFEEVSGDLSERFDKQYQTSPIKAQLNYYYEVFAYLKSFAFRSRKRTNPSLLNNNIKTSWRHLKNQPLFSIINIGGLTLGITACILISLYIQHELSYDKNLANRNIYRLYWANDNDGAEYKVLWNSPPLADVLRSEVPEIESIARINTQSISGSWSSEIKKNIESSESFFEEGFLYADKDIIKILGIDIISGNKNALAEPMTMIITQRKAEKFFPGEDPVGQLMIIGNDNANPLRIDAVIANPPANSHLQYDFIITMTDREFYPDEQQEWRSSGFYISYVRLHPDADIAATCDKMTAAAIEHMRASWWDGFLKKYRLGLQPVEDIHLYSADIRGPVSQGDIMYVWIFGAVAVFILIIACINFVNLSTARSANRAKEVGLRKTVGSSRAYIINQFLTESIIFSAISFALATLFAWLLLPQFNTIAGTSIVFPWTEWWLLPVLITGALVIGLIAGCYPAFYLSGFKPINVLKGNVVRGAKASGLRSTLVVFQFTTSIILIVSTVVIYNQLNFMINREPGFDKEQVLMLHGASSVPNTSTLKQELLRIPGVQSASISDYLPVTGSDVKRTGHPFWLTGEEQDADKQTRAQLWTVDPDYIRTMGIRIIDGRDFDENIVSDSDAIIINQQMAKDLGLTNPIGKQVSDDKTWNIIGVVENFNFESLRMNIRSLSLRLGKSDGIILVKIAPGEMISTVAAVEDTWRRFSPNQSIRYTFLDDSFAKMYDDVKRTGSIFTSFALFAVIVACLGLFALSAFMIEQRSKEISIRLLFGATVGKIFGLLTAEFMKLILVSLVISLPIAAWMAQRWLEGYHYRIELTWHVFVITGVVAITVALLTVSYQTIRAGLAKPADKLRSD